MILLDTNVVSELMKPAPDARVVAWLDRHPADTLYISAISMAELLRGLAILPDGRKKSLLVTNLRRLGAILFAGRILSFDMAAAESCASLLANARASGQAIALADGLIAAIAASQSLAVATRDVSPFQAAGLKVVNPWQD